MAINFLLGQVKEQRKLFQQTRSAMLSIRERDGIVDPDPERSDVSPTTANDAADTGPYVGAKTRYLLSKKALEAAEIKLAAQTFDGPDFDPVKIWEKAEPPPFPVRVGLRRLWNSL